jgi:hypothetical protein
VPVIVGLAFHFSDNARMTSALRLLVFTVLLVAGTGCANKDQQSSTASNVSTIPWNRPEKWEGSGALGAMVNQQ